MHKPQVYSFYMAKPVFKTRSTSTLFTSVSLHHAAKEEGEQSWACTSWVGVEALGGGAGTVRSRKTLLYSGDCPDDQAGASGF